MILTHDVILEEIEKKRILIDPFNPKHVGPCSVDLTLSNEFRIFTNSHEPFSLTENADYEKVTEPFQVKDGESFPLAPGKSILGITIEKITLPGDICGWFDGRSRFGRCGITAHITAGIIQPGISNKQVLEIVNFSDRIIKLFPGTKICQIAFHRCEGEAIYQGKFSEQVVP